MHKAANVLIGKELILATKTYAKEERWKSWYYTISTFIILVSLFSASFLLDNVLLKIFCSVLAGLVMVRMFVIYHDYMHHAILENSIVAKIIFTIFGEFILAPPSIWKRSHDYHHKHNSKLFSASIGSYPIYTKEKFLNAGKKDRFLYLFSRHPLTILFGYFFMFFYGMCYQSFTSSPSRHWDSLLSMIFHIAIIILILVFLGWKVWLISFFLPFFIACMLGAYLFYAQHNFPGVVFNEGANWNYLDAALLSSSYMRMNFFWRWVTANIGYHHIHHINARIPFYRLPEVMKNIPEMQQVKETTLNPKDIISCFRLKIWDSAKNKMISIAEL